jgi:hypothetical protein
LREERDKRGIADAALLEAENGKIRMLSKNGTESIGQVHASDEERSE